MKYNKNNKPIVCMQTTSRCYINTYKMDVCGILWHSTGANNEYIKRYVQPSDDDPNRNYLLNLIGDNYYNNDWNHSDVSAGLNCWIGKLDDDSVAAVQTMPWDYRPWGCGSGSRGSCNSGWIQFEICEDSLCDRNYFEKVYQEACELTAYLCDMYGLNPYGVVCKNGIDIPVILCHRDSYELGFGTGHEDVYHWFNRYGKSMDDVRRDVAKILETKNEMSQPTSVAVDKCIDKLHNNNIINTPSYWKQHKNDLKYLDKLIMNLSNCAGSQKVNDFNNVDDAINYVADKKIINTPGYWISNNKNVKYLDKLIISCANHIGSDNGEYKVKIMADALNIRSGAGTNSDIVGCIRDKGIYTITETINGWGKLKSGAGWICLDYCEKF